MVVTLNKCVVAKTILRGVVDGHPLLLPEGAEGGAVSTPMVFFNLPPDCHPVLMTHE